MHPKTTQCFQGSLGWFTTYKICSYIYIHIYIYMYYSILFYSIVFNSIILHTCKHQGPVVWEWTSPLVRPCQVWAWFKSLGLACPVLRLPSPGRKNPPGHPKEAGAVAVSLVLQCSTWQSLELDITKRLESTLLRGSRGSSLPTGHGSQTLRFGSLWTEGSCCLEDAFCRTGDCGCAFVHAF